MSYAEFREGVHQVMMLSPKDRLHETNDVRIVSAGELPRHQEGVETIGKEVTEVQWDHPTERIHQTTTDINLFTTQQTLHAIAIVLTMEVVGLNHAELIEPFDQLLGCR
ncbi:hypothetical protein D3C86_1751460 [compost metagenome]